MNRKILKHLKQFILNEQEYNYHGDHTAPKKGGDDAPMYDLSGIYPDDIYSHDAPRLYGDNGGNSSDRDCIYIIQSARDRVRINDDKSSYILLKRV